MPIMMSPAKAIPQNPKMRVGHAKATPNIRHDRPVDFTPYVSPAAFPHLLAADVDDTYRGHRSWRLVEALAAHRHRMDHIAAELEQLPKEDTLLRGKSSHDVAKAFVKYIQNHPTTNFASIVSAAAAAHSIAGSKSELLLSGTGLIDAAKMAPSATAPGQIYSWANLLRSISWARTLYAIIWIVLGLLLLFFGYASICWFSNASVSHKSGIKMRVSEAAQDDNDEDEIPLAGRREPERRRKRKTFRLKILSGGIGGLAIGFLFASSLITIVHNAVVVDAGRKPVNDQEFFAIWILSGLLGAVLSGHFAWLNRAFIGLLAGTCLTITLTAMFGIKTLLVRAILICVFALIMTAPLLLPRHQLVRMIVLMACTSVIGVVTFLNGIAVVAPAEAPAGNWLDLWTLLFMKKDANAHDALTSAWATSVFKGFIAAAVLGAIIGFLFQFLFHRKSSHDPNSEWNEYLGTYTERLQARQSLEEHEKGEHRSSILNREPKNDLEKAVRAGLFEKSPSPWQRMVDFFDHSSSKSQPAHYGHLTGDLDGADPKGTRDAIKYGSLRGQMKRKRDARRCVIDPSEVEAGGTNSSRPARFEPLSKTQKNAEARASKQKMLRDKGDESSDDDVDDDKTAVGSSHGDKSKAPAKGDTKDNAARHVPVTPSLLGALDRIQRAQQTAQTKR